MPDQPRRPDPDRRRGRLIIALEREAGYRDRRKPENADKCRCGWRLRRLTAPTETRGKKCINPFGLCCQHPK